MSVKNPLTPAGIEPATFRFVAQHLNHCATAVPPFPRGLRNSSKCDSVFQPIDGYLDAEGILMSLTTFQALHMSRTKRGGGTCCFTTNPDANFLIFHFHIDKQIKFNEQSITARDIMTTDRYLQIVVHSREFRHAKVNPETSLRSVL